MRKISEALKSQIKEAINLLELVEEYTDMHPIANNVWQGHCPHPDHDDSTSSFTVYYKDKRWTWCCYGCSSNSAYGSDCFGFIRWMSDYKGSKHKIGWKESVEILAKKASVPIGASEATGTLERLRRRAKSYHANLFPVVKEYLYERGLNDEDLNEWLIGFSTFEECVRAGGRKYYAEIPRIVFPLFDRHKQVVGFSNRKFAREDIKAISKYRNSPGSELFQKNKYLYGIHNYDSSFEEIRITEGQMDVILSNKYGARNIMAPLGTAFSEAHIEFIKKENKVPCFCLDGDVAGQKATQRKVAMLAAKGIYAKVLILPDGMDMADMANKYKDKLENYIMARSLPYWQYILQDKALEYEAKVNELRTQMLPEILEACKSIKSDQDNLLLNSYLRKKFGILR